jgi:MAGUK p55 subfamily protein 5
MKQTIAGDKTTKEKSKKAGTLLCAKKNPKKKKKKAPYNVAYNDGGYPLYATSTIDGKCCDAVLGVFLMYNPQQMYACGAHLFIAIKQK